jgi:hypothetical protein
MFQHLRQRKNKIQEHGLHFIATHFLGHDRRALLSTEKACFGSSDTHQRYLKTRSNPCSSKQPSSAKAREQKNKMNGEAVLLRQHTVSCGQNSLHFGHATRTSPTMQSIPSLLDTSWWQSSGAASFITLSNRHRRCFTVQEMQIATHVESHDTSLHTDCFRAGCAQITHQAQMPCHDLASSTQTQPA